MCVERSQDCPKFPIPIQSDDIHSVLSIGLFDIEFCDEETEPLLARKEEEYQSLVPVSHESSTHRTGSITDCSPILNTVISKDSLGSGNQERSIENLTIGRRTNGEATPYSDPWVETCEDSPRILSSKSGPVGTGHTDVSNWVVDDLTDGIFDHNSILFSEQSIPQLESMISGRWEKNSVELENLTFEKGIDSTLQSDLEKEQQSTIMDEKHQISIWSIFGDCLDYPCHIDKHVNYYLTEAQNSKYKRWLQVNNIEVQESEEQDHNFFDEYYFLEQKSDTDLPCKTDSDNSGTQESEENCRYKEVRSNLKPFYNPQTDISTTYLYSMPDADIQATNTNDCFRSGRIALTGQMRASAKLLDGTPISTLFDSGATCSMLSTSVFKQSKLLQSYPIYEIPEIPIRIADGSCMKASEAIKLLIEIKGHVFETIAYLVPMGDSLDFIFGVKSAAEIEGKIDVAGLQFEFKIRTIPVRPETKVTVAPGNKATYWAKLDNVPKDFDSGRIVLKVTASQCRTRTPQILKAMCINGRFKLTVHNASSTKLLLTPNDIIAQADMRSVGYFYMSRSTLQRLLEKTFVFVEEDFRDSKETNCRAHESAEPDPTKNMGNVPRPPLKGPLGTKLETKFRQNEHNKGVKYINGVRVDPNDPYPHLDRDDPRRNMTDREILEKFVDLSKSELLEAERKEVYDLLERYKEAFSLRDEIGECPDIEIDLELHDDTPFFIRPYPVKESDKPFIDKEMRKGCLLGILRKGLSSYSSPIMLIPRKQSSIPRIVTDFRYLNSRLKVLQCSLPLVRDAIQQLGAAESEVVSIIDLRDAFHTLRVKLTAQQYLGIRPYYGSPTYLYQRLGMGLSVSPSIFMHFITKVLDEIEQNRRNYIAIMDDILIHSKLRDHKARLTELFKTLIKNGLKISPKKCQLFMKNVLYMGHQISYEGNVPTIRPTREKCDAIRRIEKLKGVNSVRSFCGMVNYLSMYMPSLQEHLVPLYELLKKGAKWDWTERCQKAFEKIKEMLVKPPVLVMPNLTGHFTLVSDTSKLATGAALYQEQKGELHLIAYNSKRLPEAAQRYSISELELLGLTINIASFKHYLRGTHFSVVIDHSALVYIMNSKREPPTLRLKKLLEILSQYSFSIRYLKGKEMHVSDFLSRHPGKDTSSPNEIIPIAFLLNNQSDEAIPETLLTATRQTKDQCMVTTRHQSKKKGDQLPTIWPLKGEHKKPEHMPKPEPFVPDHVKERDTTTTVHPQKMEPAKTLPTPQELPRPPDLQPPYLPTYSQQKPSDQQNWFQPQVPDLPVLQKPQLPNIRGKLTDLDKVPPLEIPKPIPIDVRLKGYVPAFDSNINTNDKDIRKPDDILYQKPQNLFDQIDNRKIMRQHLPNQHELDRYLNKLKSKIIHNYKVPLSAKELIPEFKRSPFFKDIYKYIQSGRLPSDITGKAARTLQRECEQYIIVEEVLFRIKQPVVENEDLNLILCIPEKYTPHLLYYYHDTLLAGHQGVTRMYLTLRERYFVPNLFECIRNYILSCQQCQLTRLEGKHPKAHHIRIPYDFRPMTRLSMDVKDMPITSSQGHKHILIMACEISNYVLAAPLYSNNSMSIAEAVLNKVVYQFGPPSYIIADEAQVNVSKLMELIYTALNIKPIIISPENHGSLKAERYIRTISDMLVKYMKHSGDQWHLYVNACCYAHNTFVTPTMGYSPFEMVYLQKPVELIDIQFNPLKGQKLSVRQYIEMMKNRFSVIKQIVAEKKLQTQQAQLEKQDRIFPNRKEFAVGDLVHLHAPRLSSLQTNSQKFKNDWIGPLQIQAVLDKSHYMLADFEGKILPFFGSVHINRLKHYYINLGKMHGKKIATVSNTKDLVDLWMKLYPEP